METEKDTTIQIKRLANDSEYFNSVFKKTEKLVSVVFYVLSQINTTKDTETYRTILKDRAIKTHEVSLQSLRLQTHEASIGLLDLQFALVDLESTMRIAEAAGVIPQSLTTMLFEQLITVERFLANHYLKPTSVDLNLTESLGTSKANRSVSKQRTDGSRVQSLPARRRSVNIPQNDISSDAYMVYSQLTDRAERIKTVLEAKPQATIRDISDIITDVSEKTIQRELNSLIEKGQVIRQGERRWSKYLIAK